jgi:hypothetical protein
MRFKSRYTSIAASLGLLLLLVLTTAALNNALSTDDLWSLYDKSVVDSAVYRHDSLRQLYPLKFDAPTMTTTVVTLTGYDYPLGQQALSRDVWVTAVPEVQQKCQKFTDPDLQMRLRELLGLQPTATFTYFVTMTVRADDVFRPAPNPVTVTQSLCDRPESDSTCGELFPNWVGNEHKAWIANKALTSYLVSADHNGAYSYPWTRLGYTYDWKPGADKYGASEYVIRPGSIVTVTSKTPYAQYCAAK